MTRGDRLSDLPALIGQLVEDARALARAEIKLAKAKGAAFARRSRTAVILVVIALLAVQGAVVALAVGLVLQLAILVGGALAGLIVMVMLLAIAGLLVWIALRAFSGRADPSAVVDPAA